MGKLVLFIVKDIFPRGHCFIGQQLVYVLYGHYNVSGCDDRKQIQRAAVLTREVKGHICNRCHLLLFILSRIQPFYNFSVIADNAFLLQFNRFQIGENYKAQIFLCGKWNLYWCVHLLA